MLTYQLNLINNAQQPFTFIVYQASPGFNIFSLVWLCSQGPVMQQNLAQFTWQTNYAMFWGQTGQVQPGVQFTPGGQTAVDPQAQNYATFTTQPYPNFTNLTQGQPVGVFTIAVDNSIPPYMYAVGIGLSGSPSLITSAQPNYNYQLPSNLPYLISAVQPGAINAGTVLDPRMLSNSLQLPGGQYSLSYSFDGNQWSQR